MATETNFRPNSQTQDLQLYNSSVLEFGFQEAQKDFWGPVMKFQFYDNTGNETDSLPVIFIRMIGTFETTLSNPFQEQEGIFGTPFDTNSGFLETLQKAGGTGLEALRRQLLGGVGGAAGKFLSAGATGVPQAEFLTRQMINNFQQLIYKGPQFRRFTPSFTFRPTSLNEAQAMRDIITLFRYASSPSLGESSISGFQSTLGSSTFDPANVDDEKLSEEERDAIRLNAEGQINDEDVGTLAAGATFTFGYPDMCKLSIVMASSGDTSQSLMFESKLCVIENVQITYGSQNKMTFYEGDNENYFPSDVIMNISLRESVLLTRNDVAQESSILTKTIF